LIKKLDLAFHQLIGGEMKRLTLAMFLAVLMIFSVAAADNVIKVDREFGSSFIGYAPDRCIVTFKEGVSPHANQQAIFDINQKFQVGHFDKEFPMAEWAGAKGPADRALNRKYKVRFPIGQLDDVIAAYRALPSVEKVEPVGMYLVSATPNDRYYDDPPAEFPYDQWHYWDTYGIEADMAWDIETGDPDVVCAVIDGGVRYYHYELGGTNPPGPADNSTNGNIWVNPGEIPANGIDDDNNGYVDDVIGYDFVDEGFQCTDSDCGTVDNDPSDYGGHGTHVAGTIAAITNNDATFGVAGIAGGWNNGTTDDIANGVKIMCLRAGYMTRRGGVMYMDMVSEALYYVATMVDKGINVTAINCSWGSSSLLADAIDAVIARDVMVIVAAGNANNTDADYLGTREDCLDVGATDITGVGASFSTYGSWVDIAAPGVDILSTFHNSDDPDNDYIALMDGTSMACPHVVGVAGLLESYDPSLTAQDKWNLIVNNSKPYDQSAKYVGVGIVDARACLDAIGGTGCDVVADFSGPPTSGCIPLTVSFTDASTGPVTSWSWDFGDGGSSTAENPSHQYTSPGNYTVSLTVTSATCNDTETKTSYIAVSDVVTANFSGTPTSGTAPLTVNFTDLSTGNPTSWSWNFGDGGSSASQNPSHIYTAEGTYSVTLTASNGCGSDIESKTGYITVSPGVQNYMHVSGIVVTRTGNNQKSGVARVTIVDQNNNPVAGAVVSGYFSAPNSNIKTGTTGTDGVATLTSDRTKTYPSDWCFTVTDVTLANYTYDDAANVVTEACESGPVYGSAKTVFGVVPEGFALGNYPNPFNPATTISFTLPSASYTRLEVYNILGQSVVTLVDGYLHAGSHSVVWDAHDAASGIYLYRLSTDYVSTTKQMILMK